MIESNQVVPLAPLAAARLADAVLPVAGKLLSVRPDSALHLGEGGCEVRHAMFP